MGWLHLLSKYLTEANVEGLILYKVCMDKIFSLVKDNLPKPDAENGRMEKGLDFQLSPGLKSVF